MEDSYEVRNGKNAATKILQKHLFVIFTRFRSEQQKIFGRFFPHFIDEKN